MDRNNTDFPTINKRYLLNQSYDKTTFFQYHQFVFLKYLEKHPDIRGMLIFFQMGYGKTLAVIGAIDFYKKRDPQRRVILILPKTLIENFKKDLQKYKSVTPDCSLNVDEFTFISLNSGKSYEKLAEINVDGGDDGDIGAIKKAVTKGSLENTLLVIDEAHNLFNSIIHGSKNGVGIYNKIMGTSDIKLFMLTGSPIVNSPIELIPCFNMIEGRIKTHHNTKFDLNETLFPDDVETFEKIFVDEEKMTIKNRALFQNRIFGKLSYYGNLFNSSAMVDFPAIKTLSYVKVPMSSEQYTTYNIARDAEKQEQSFGKKHTFIRDVIKRGKTSTTFRIRSRQASNFVFPKTALEIKDNAEHTKKVVVKYPQRLTKEDFDNLSTYSPKIKSLLGEIPKHEGLGLIYTEFVKNEGVEVLSWALSLSGYEEWKPNMPTAEPKKRFAVITGDVPVKNRSAILEKFNEEENMMGKNILLLIISKSGAEGINVKCVRHLHILEPFWNFARMEQVIYRAVRFRSHISLPEDKRNVSVFIYLAVHPNFFYRITQEATTDMYIMNTARSNKKIINSFLMAMIEASMDCSVHYEKAAQKPPVKCMECHGNNMPLYGESVEKDLSVTDQCKRVGTEKEIEAKKITVNGLDYFYSLGKDKSVAIYHYSDDLGEYVLLTKADPKYTDVFRKVSHDAGL